MADIGKIHLNAQELFRDATLNIQVDGMNSLLFRVRVGIFLIRIAARVMGCKVQIEESK